MTDDKPDETFTIADASESKRFPVAVAFSLAVNLFLLVGAGTLVRELPEPPASDIGYIFLDTIERDSSEAIPVADPVKARPLSIPRIPSAPIRDQKTAPAPARQVSTPAQADPSKSIEPSDSPDRVEKETQTPRSVSGAVPTTEFPAVGTEAEVAASDVLPGEVAPLPGTGDGAPSSSSDLPPSPGPSPVPGPATEPVGVTKTAETAYHELPRIPDSLRESGYRSFVGVEVEVKEDGSFSVTIRTSSGNPDVDGRVLDALKRWKWKPALKNGVPITSVESFRFDFGVD